MKEGILHAAQIPLPQSVDTFGIGMFRIEVEDILNSCKIGGLKGVVEKIVSLAAASSKPIAIGVRERTKP